MVTCPACNSGSCNETANEKVIQRYCLDCSFEDEVPNSRPKVTQIAPDPTPIAPKKKTKHWTES